MSLPASLQALSDSAFTALLERHSNSLQDWSKDEKQQLETVFRTQ